METQMIMDSKTRNLNLNFKKSFEHSSDVKLKVRGVLDTQTATGQFQASLHKFFMLGSLPPVSQDFDNVFQPDTRLRIGVGAKASTQNDEVLFNLNARKKVVLRKQQAALRNRMNLLTYSQLRLAANYDYSLRSEKWSGEALAEASHAIFGFSQGQDLRVTVGYRAKFAQGAATTAEPFLRVQENCWGIRTTLKGDWLVTYDL